MIDPRRIPPSRANLCAVGENSGRTQNRTVLRARKYMVYNGVLMILFGFFLSLVQT
jgi:hypothetical protein